MSDDSLLAPARPDRFTSESPIRAFTEFRVAGTWAIGKGFRPSLAHMHTYLDAMQHKEGWHLVQMLDGGTLDPTLIFQRDRTMSFTVPERKIGKHPALGEPYKPSLPTWTQHGSEEEIPREHRLKAAEYVIGRLMQGDQEKIEPVVRDFKKRFMGSKTVQVSHTTLASQIEFLISSANPIRIKQLIDGFREEHRLGFRDPYQEFAESALEVASDDPVNPKHYAGTVCAEIGELLTANSYQVLKYNWRLGEKDSPCVELGKALWYLDREIMLLDGYDVGDRSPFPGLPNHNLPVNSWFDERLEGKDAHVVRVAHGLIEWNRGGNGLVLKSLRVDLQSKLDAINGCADWGRGLAI